MKKIMITLLGATSILLSTIVASHSFEGFSVGVNISTADFDIKGREFDVDSNTADESETSAFVKRSVSTDILEGFIEYTFAQGTTMGISMIQGTADLGNAQRVEAGGTSGTATGNTSGTVKVKAEVSDPTTFYVEPTWMASDVFGVYVKGAATKVSVEPKEVSDTGGVVTSTYKSEDVWGFGTGVGAKYYMGNFFAKLEYLKTDFQAYNHQSTTGDKNKITADIETEETNLSIGYNF